MIGALSISLSALRHNAGVLRDLVGRKRTAFVVKGNAYGHGLVPTALAVESYATRLCVYTIEEALALRTGGVTVPILVLGPVPPAAIDDALSANVELSLWSTKEFARLLCTAARKRQTPAVVHVKVNTDLNRLGFEPHELVDALEEFLRLPEIEIAGIFSHLASAEELDSPYTMHQLEAFERALAHAAPLLERRSLTPLRHIAASAAAMLWPQTRLDMVRFGIALYGLIPSPQTREALAGSALDLHPALSYRSQIVVVRTVAAGASVVDGALCLIVGRVARNMTEIDLSRAPRARVGSTVTLIGRDGDAVVGADDWANWAETINYEIVARLPAELPREYVDS